MRSRHWNSYTNSEITCANLWKQRIFQCALSSCYHLTTCYPWKAYGLTNWFQGTARDNFRTGRTGSYFPAINMRWRHLKVKGQHEHAWWRRLDVERFAASYLLTEYCTYGSVSLDSFLTDFFQFFSAWLSSLHKWNKGDFEVRTWTRSANEWTLMNVTMKLVGYIRRL